MTDVDNHHRREKPCQAEGDGMGQRRAIAKSIEEKFTPSE